MRRLRQLIWGQAEPNPPGPRPVRRGVPVEMRWAQETVWVGVMDLDLPPLEMVPEMMRRASNECFPASSESWWPLHNRTHPNDFTGYPAVMGDPSTWIMVVDVKKHYRY